MHHASRLVDTRPPSVQLHSSAHHQRLSDPQRRPRLVSTFSRASTSRHRSADLCASGDAASSMCPRPPSTWQLCFIGNAAPSRCASCDQHTAHSTQRPAPVRLVCTARAVPQNTPHAAAKHRRRARVCQQQSRAARLPGGGRGRLKVPRIETTSPLPSCLAFPRSRRSRRLSRR